MPVQNLAKLCRGIEEMYEKYNYHDGSAFGHALEGNLHLVFTQGFDTPAEVQRCALAPHRSGHRLLMPVPAPRFSFEYRASSKCTTKSLAKCLE